MIHSLPSNLILHVFTWWERLLDRSDRHSLRYRNEYLQISASCVTKVPCCCLKLLAGSYRTRKAIQRTYISPKPPLGWCPQTPIRVMPPNPNSALTLPLYLKTSLKLFAGSSRTRKAPLVLVERMRLLQSSLEAGPWYHLWGWVTKRSPDDEVWGHGSNVIPQPAH